jgi:death-on-curing protein
MSADHHPEDDYLDLDDMLAAATAALGRAPEVRDWGLLDAAVNRPKAVAFGEDAYPGLHEKAAALFESLARYHALIDGNERLAWVATRLFYVLNGLDLRAPSVDEGQRLVLSVIDGGLDVHKLAQMLANWSAALA